MKRKLFTGYNGHKAEVIYNYFKAHKGTLYSTRPVPTGFPQLNHTLFLMLDGKIMDLRDTAELATWFTQLGLISPRAWCGEYFVTLFAHALLKAHRDSIRELDIKAELEEFDAKHFDLSMTDPPIYHQCRKNFIGRKIREWIKVNTQQD